VTGSLAHPSRAAPFLKDRQFVAALARGLEILRAFAPSETLLGNQEIAARTGLPKPTVSRLTHTLTRLGYLTYSERLGKYQLGTPVLALGYAVSRDRLNLIYVEYCRPDSTVTLRLDVGSRIPIATTSMGRALLAALPEQERAYLMEHIARREGELGVPLIPGDGSPILALNCGGPSFQLPRERLEREIGPRLVNLVRNIEAALGHR
jgi:DNA-binding IclR family transcriptional regulator